MRIALIADAFPPLRTSASVQLRDLSREFAKQSHAITVMLPTPGLKTPWLLEYLEGVQVLRLRAPKTKDINYVSRTINEFLTPFIMLRNLRKSPLSKERWNGVVWYSPSIFFGPIVNFLKKGSGCKSYLIIRDIFPEWALDMGLMKRGLSYKFFKAVAHYQYSIANVIGVQTQGNEVYFQKWRQQSRCRLEVLQNWLADTPPRGCSIDISKTSLAGRKLFVYAGNIGVAQGVSILIDLAEKLVHQKDVGFLFVGRGSEAKKLASEAQARSLHNVMFFDEIEPQEIPSLYLQCRVGLVALDSRHKSHNIPGKFLTYIQSGLPVLANINAGNDLVNIILHENLGRVNEDSNVDNLAKVAMELINSLEIDDGYHSRCKALYSRMFAPETAVKQIVAALSAENYQID